ncbi:5,6-dimethylbenzimidazole synthase [Agrobacterium tumefaciens]|nr:5,6-dimethylbenzimidazole synthase [Agrobacterium tumefaciens]
MPADPSVSNPPGASSFDHALSPARPFSGEEREAIYRAIETVVTCAISSCPIRCRMIWWSVS